MAKVLFIGTKDLIRYTPIAGSIDRDKVIHYIEIAQDIHIQQILGTDLLNKLIADVQGSSLSGVYLEIMNLVKPCLSHYAFMEYLPFSMYSITNKGVYKHASENSDAVPAEEIDRLTEQARDKGNYYAARITDYLEHNSHQVPEYLSNTEEDINPIRNAHRFGGWQI
jgi:hypothetical protein